MATPMFPLGSTLVPYSLLPLRVFEPRYLELVRDCLEADREFGVVLIERGYEVGGGDTRFDVGCVARIVDVRTEGRMLRVLAVGDRRARVVEWLPDGPYPRAELEDWPEPDPDPEPGLEDELAVTLARSRRVLALASELGQGRAPATVVISDDPVVASHQLTAVVPVSELDRLQLLAEPTAGGRLRRLRALLDDVEVLLSHQLGT
ncbi:MAG: LON peptidase substrate-binding domain-containing protein [Acidimicrobiia bacterium]